MKPLWIIVRVYIKYTHTLFSHRLHILTLRSYFIALFPLCSLPCVLMWFLYMQLNKPSEPPTATETAPLSPGEVYYEPTGREPVTVTITHINMHTHTQTRSQIQKHVLLTDTWATLQPQWAPYLFGQLHTVVGTSWCFHFVPINQLLLILSCE